MTHSSVEKRAGVLYNTSNCDVMCHNTSEYEVHMKKLSRTLAAFLIILALTVSTAKAAGAGEIVYSNSWQVADNLAYTQTVSYITTQSRQLGYSLSLTGAGDAYPILMAVDTIYGGLTMEQMIHYAESQGKNVLAAVNTDFFSMKTGVPMGIVVENGVYKSSPESNTALAFKEDGSIIFSESPEVTVTLSNQGGNAETDNIGKTVALTHFNKYRTDTGGLYLFSSAFSTVSTRTTTPGWFVVFRILDGAPSVSGTMSLVVEDVLMSDVEIPIEDGTLVLSAAESTGLVESCDAFAVGDAVELTTTCTEDALTDVQWATGGGDILIQNGAMTDQEDWDKAITANNPRTAFGVKADGTLVSYLADGRQPGRATGMTLKSLAEEMLAQGCVTAVNLDGGGSSVISVRLPGLSTSAIVNNPSDGSSRRCGAYLLFVTDKLPDGRVKHIGISNDGLVILAGSSVTLDLVGIDGGYKPVTVPSDVVISSGGLGTLSSAIYTAGPVHGVDHLTLRSPSTGADGTATMHIIYDPTDVVVTKQGSATKLSALTLNVGDTIQLSSSATYNLLPVTVDADAVHYSLSDDIGTITDTGLLTVGTGGGVTGTVTVSIGSFTKSIPVTVNGFSDILDHWAKDFILDLSDREIVSGVTPGIYSPEASMKRGDFVLMLYRAAGKPSVTEPSSFTDVLSDDYYAEAIAWAEVNGIAQGTGGDVFEPEAILPRQQAFALIYRALAVLNINYQDGSPDGLTAFTDYTALLEYAAIPTATLVEMGIVSGSGNMLLPTDMLTRAQMAKILDMVLMLA